MTTKAKNRCTVTLKQKYVHIGTYRPTQEIFYEIQKEFFHIFNSLYANSKQIVLTSNIAPKDLESFEERLKVRFFWGLIIKINPLNHNQL